MASALQGGIYHGRILLPSEYPFKPPSFLMLTPNGRFETGVKVTFHQCHAIPVCSLATGDCVTDQQQSSSQAAAKEA